MDIDAELDSLWENYGEWDGIRIDAYANGDMPTYRQAIGQMLAIEKRCNELESDNVTVCPKCESGLMDPHNGFSVCDGCGYQE